MQEPDIQAAMNEAVACFNSGRLARAEEIYRRVVVDSPSASRYGDLGVICGKQGKHDEAVDFFRKAAELQPKSADFHFKLGRALQKCGKTDDAIRSLQQALLLNPRHADASSELGCAHLERGDTDGAIACFRTAIAVDPPHYYAHNNLGVAFRKQGKSGEAIEFHRRAIALKPEEPTAYDSLGMAYFALNRLEDAISCYRKSIALNPGIAAPHCNLGNAYVMSLRLDDAIASHERAIALDPGYGGFHWNYASALLLAGRFDRGWQEYEWRWKAPELKKQKPAYHGPEWRGEDVGGKTVLLYDEQGYGDVIQFVRYASLVAGRGGKVLLATRPELARLLAGAAGVSGVICPGDPPRPFDFHLPLLSLPCLFKTTLGTIPSNVPYLRADEALVKAWGARTAGAKALRVGLIWGGKHGFAFDPIRSCALADLAPLSRVGGVQFYSLQKGEQAGQAKAPPAGMSLIDWSGELGDFAETAALMENLDLIISVDTAGVHLAGALGRPVWLLNRYQTEWRWLLDREDSPWYPTLRLFRQPKVGDWASVMERVSAELAKLAAAR